jgi:hypothetical protein
LGGRDREERFWESIGRKFADHISTNGWAQFHMPVIPSSMGEAQIGEWQSRHKVRLYFRDN